MATDLPPTSSPESHRRISRLSSDLVNQIAAGEVVERPSSLIKELVENSLDAGSTRIEVHLKEGGLGELSVIDDGCGILEEDLPLAVERHTTSKLSSLEDLDSISTFGFRGEALSSIASVSDFSIRSRPRTSEKGMVLNVPYGEIEEIKPIGCPPGTQVVVKNLFAKIPARFKFLRSQTTELAHCAKIFRELALGNPQTAFFLHHNGRLLSKFTANTRAERFKEVLKPDWEPLHFKESLPEMAFEAFLSPLHWTQERGELVFFINQRPVKNRLLLSCLKQSFIEIAGPHHEPSGVFYLDIQGDWVDVNVHPQKLEVRFYRQERIYSWVLNSLKKQLLQLKRQLGSNFPSEEFGSPISSQEGNHNLGLPVPKGLTNSTFRFLGIVQSKYFLLENPNGLYILNPQALWERIHFSRFQKELETGRLRSDFLSVASVISFTQDTFLQIQDKLPLLSRLGFEIELFGDKDIAIKAVPAGLTPSLASESIPKLVSLPAGTGPEDSVLKALAYLSQQVSASKSTEPENWPQTQALLANISELNETWTCPQGKPVLFKISWHQLEQHFKTL